MLNICFEFLRNRILRSHLTFYCTWRFYNFLTFGAVNCGEFKQIPNIMRIKKQLTLVTNATMYNVGAQYYA